MDDFYSSNIPPLTEEQQRILLGRTVAVIGCGGLGGYAAEYLARAGVGGIVAVDGDRFEKRNMNRQILSLEETLGENKAEAARERALRIRPGIRFRAVPEHLTDDNAGEILDGADLAVDALDSAEARLLLYRHCAGRGIPVVHGAVQGWSGHAATVLPGNPAVPALYSGEAGIPRGGVLSFVPAFCAAVQIAEAVRILTGETPELAGKMFVFDLESMMFNTVKFRSSGEEADGRKTHGD